MKAADCDNECDLGLGWEGLLYDPSTDAWGFDLSDMGIFYRFTVTATDYNGDTRSLLYAIWLLLKPLLLSGAIMGSGTAGVGFAIVRRNTYMPAGISPAAVGAKGFHFPYPF